MNEQNKQALIEGVKTFARNFILSMIPLAITQLQTLERFDFRLLFIAGAIGGLTGLDKFLHKSDVPVNGLMPF